MQSNPNSPDVQLLKIYSKANGFGSHGSGEGGMGRSSSCCSAAGSTTLPVFLRQQCKRMPEAGIVSGTGKCEPWKEVIHFLLDAPSCPLGSARDLYRQG